MTGGAGRRRWALAAAAATLISVLATRPARAAMAGPGFAVGISPGAGAVHQTASETARTMGGMAAAGDRWVRLDVPWVSIEGRRGSFSWTAEDAAVRSARSHGLQVDALIDDTPGWAMPAGQPDPALAAAFVATVVHRYAPLGVHTYEIWNEENLNSYWEAPVSALGYGRVLKAAYSAVHRADRRGFVVLGGLARTSGTTPGLAVDPTAYLAALYQDGFGRYFDAAAVHPYSYPDSPTSPAADNSLNALAGIHALMAGHGDAGKRIWVTEYGYSTGAQVLTGLVPPTNDSDQATYLAAAIQRVRAEPWAGPFFVFSWQDDMWQAFGLLRSDGSPKPALAVFERSPH